MKSRDFPESRLYAPIAAWLAMQGYRIYPEAWGHDAVAIRENHIVTVELKMGLTHDLLRQLTRASVFSDAVYAAVPCQPRTSSLTKFARFGFGVLRVCDGVEILCESTHQKTWVRDHQKVLAALNKWAPPTDRIGGLPNLAGDGDAQRVSRAIANYRESHPKASWRELFAEVPNHYANHNSMRQAIGAVQKWALRRQRSEVSQ